VGFLAGWCTREHVARFARKACSLARLQKGYRERPRVRVIRRACFRHGLEFICRMERIKLAIEKARESADQLQKGQERAAAGEAVPLLSKPAYAASLRSTRAQGATGPAGSIRTVRTLTPLLLAGLAVAGGLWFMRDSGPATVPATEQGSVAPAPVPQLAAAVPSPPIAEPASPAAVGKTVPSPGA
jgi:hypothetical protein